MTVLNGVALTLAHVGPGGRDAEGWWWIGGPLVFFAMWLTVFALFWFVVLRRRGPRERSGIERARDVLAERYARGEITTDEYRERLQQLV